MRTIGADGLLRRTAPFAAATVGLAVGVLQLTDLAATGVPRVLLGAIAIALLLYAVVQTWHLFYVRRIEDLKSQIEDLKAQRDDLGSQRSAMHAGHQQYVEAIGRIMDEEGPLYAEHLQLTVTVGADDDTDRVVERRRTAPMPRITSRSISPIVPSHTDRYLGVDDLDLQCTLVDATGVVRALPIGGSVNPRVWLVFQPGMTGPFTWEVSYRPRGMWRPLREQGHDFLVWSDRLPVGQRSTSVLTELVVTFIFPPSDQPPRIQERHGIGMTEGAKRTDGDRWLITWYDPQPDGRRYEWDLAQAVRLT